MKRILLLVVAWMMFLSSHAQEKVISGRVTSAEDGGALPGINILQKGTSNGTVTDANGNYKITMNPSSSTLIFSFIGYVTSEVDVATRAVVDVSMEVDVKQLSEVVVVGYGTQIKQELTGNIASVAGKDIGNMAVPSVDQALQGRAAGVFVEAGTGKLGQGIKIRVRGSSSVSAGNQPLYVVDGIPITSSNQSSATADTNPLTDINPADIESIDILKDASASAIYGARAANGVVIITTKRGKTGKTNFNLGYQTGFSEATGHREWLNTAEYVELFREGRQNSENLRISRPGLGIPNPGTIAAQDARFTRYGAGNINSWQNSSSPDYVNTTWEDQVLVTGKVNILDLSASGGTDKTKFYASGSHSDQKGILIGNKLERISGRVNLDHQATDKLSLGLNFNLTKTTNFRLADDNAFSTPMQIVALSPMTPVYDPRTNLLSGALDLATGIPNDNFPLYYNPLLDSKYGSRETNVFRNFGGAYGQYKITPALSIRTEFGYDLLTQHEERYYGKETYNNTGYLNGFGADVWTQVFNYTSNTFLRYEKSLTGNSFLDVTGGMSYQKSARDYSYVEGQEFPSNSYKEITSAAKITGGDSQETAFSFLSYFARANYKIKNRYLFGLSGRIDGSSRFGKDNRFGFFPAASAGWVISEEAFLADNKVIEFLKLRASYGITGNAEIGNFDSRGLYAGDGGYAGVPGQRPSQLENPNLGWETTAQVDIGIDFGFFNNRVSGELDYYEKKTSDLLLNVNLPGTAGLSTQTRNLGKMENKGFEVVINTSNLVGDLKWNTSFNFARNTNKVTDLNDQVVQGSFLNRAIEGQPIGVFYGPKYAGVDPANGDALFYTKNASGELVTTNVYNDAEYMVLGNPNPDFIGGITNTFSYKGIDLSFMFQGVYGNEVYNGGGKFMSSSGSNGYDNQTKDQLRRWRNPGDITDVPQARVGGRNGTGESSRYLSDASYLRLKTITLGYNLPSSLVSKANLTRVRVYTSAINLLTITNYEGWDPEVNSDTYAGNVNQGIDFYSAPQPKTITFGVNIGF